MRISCTWLDAHRLYMDEETPWMDESKLIAQIRGSEPFSPAAETGTNAHRLLQEPHRWAKVDGVYTVGKDRFYAEDFDRVILRNGAFLPEVRFEKDLTIDGDWVELVGKADFARGRILGEFKFKIDKPATPEDYFHARQPFLYLWMGGFDRIDYQVFSLRAKDDGVWRIGSECLFTLYPYRNMAADCMQWVREFVAWSAGKDLTRCTV